MRDYDKEPIKIIDRAVYFQANSLFIALISFYAMYRSDTTAIDLLKFNNKDSLLLLIAVVLFIAQIQWYVKCRRKISYFEFFNDKISYEFAHDSESNKCIDVSNADKINFCIVSELIDSLGRFHYLTSYELYKKSSIGVECISANWRCFYTIR